MTVHVLLCIDFEQEINVCIFCFYVSVVIFVCMWT